MYEYYEYYSVFTVRGIKSKFMPDVGVKCESTTWRCVKIWRKFGWIYKQNRNVFTAFQFNLNIDKKGGEPPPYLKAWSDI